MNLHVGMDMNACNWSFLLALLRPHCGLFVCCRYEALTFLIMYALYISLMYFNRSLEAWIVPKFPNLGNDQQVLKQTQLTSLANDEDTASHDDEEEEWDAAGMATDGGADLCCGVGC